MNYVQPISQCATAAVIYGPQCAENNRKQIMWKLASTAEALFANSQINTPTETDLLTNYILHAVCRSCM